MILRNEKKIGNKKCLFVTGRLGNGGAERRILYLINEIVKYEVTVYLAVSGNDGSYMHLLSPKCKVIKIKGALKFGWFIRVLSFLKILYTIKPDVVYANLWDSGFLVKNCFYFYKKPVRFIYGISSTLNAYQGYRASFEQLLRDKNVVLILQTERIRKSVLLYRKSGQNVYVIPNIIDSHFIHSKVLNKYTCPADEYRLVHVGRFITVKRHDRLLKIVRLLKNKGLNFRLELIGEGPLEKEVLRLAKEMNIRELITFHGFKNNPFAIMANADVLLLTSDHEGMPNVLIEALVLGVPIVSTDIEYGPKEIIQQGVNGYISEKNDLETFANYVITVLKNKDNFSKKARISSQRFYVENHIKEYLNIMEIV